MEKTDIKSLSLEELTLQLEQRGLPKFRARQIYRWLHGKQAASFGEMTDLSKDLRQGLEEAYELTSLKKISVQISKADETRKYLFALSDGNVIESVRMKYKYGNSVCISSQVGCRMGCRFCASTLEGLERNLTPAEMLDQVYQIQRDLGERISHVVVMGSGEPFDNYDNLIRFLHLLTGEDGLHISQRNVTISTCGIVPAIRRFAKEDLSVTLAVSLHAPSDLVRKRLMPAASQYAIEDILAACREYFQKTGRRLTFEYSLVKGINDAPEHAAALAKLLKGQHGHVNLIPVNPIKERDYVPSDKKAAAAFSECLEKNGIPVTVRREMGRDVSGACGQLRKSFLEREKEG